VIPVDQTVFGAPDGNCYSAALASILEIPLEDVPHFTKLVPYETTGPEWHRVTNEWALTQGFFLLALDAEANIAVYQEADLPMPWADAYHLICGEARRGDDLIRHVVVGKGGEMVHDPNSEHRNGLETVDLFEFLVPLDPARREVSALRRLVAMRLLDFNRPTVENIAAEMGYDAPDGVAVATLVRWMVDRPVEMLKARLLPGWEKTLGDIFGGRP